MTVPDAFWRRQPKVDVPPYSARHRCRCCAPLCVRPPTRGLGTLGSRRRSRKYPPPPPSQRPLGGAPIVGTRAVKTRRPHRTVVGSVPHPPC